MMVVVIVLTAAILFKTENEIKAHKNVCKNHDYCYMKISKNGKNIVKYNYGEKFMNMSFVFFIYDDTEPLLET